MCSMKGFDQQPLSFDIHVYYWIFSKKARLTDAKYTIDAVLSRWDLKATHRLYI